MTDNPMTAPPKLEPDVDALIKQAHDLDIHPYRTPQGEADLITLCHQLADCLAARLPQLSAPGADAGWVLVPREPTEAMMAAGRDANDRYATEVAPCSSFRAAAAWEAMLAAAPANNVQCPVCFYPSFDRPSRAASPATSPSGDERAAAEEAAEEIAREVRSAFSSIGKHIYLLPTVWADIIVKHMARAKHTSGPHSPAPGLSEEERAFREIHAIAQDTSEATALDDLRRVLKIVRAVDLRGRDRLASEYAAQPYTLCNEDRWAVERSIQTLKFEGYGRTAQDLQDVLDRLTADQGTGGEGCVVAK